MSTNWWLSPTKGARLGSSLWYAAALASSSGQKGIFKWLFSAATYSNVPADGRCQLLMYRGGEKGCRKSEVGKLCDIWITLVLGRENDGQKINKRGEGIWGTERWRKKEKGKGVQYTSARKGGYERTLKTARLTCLCLYSSRQATMWVDMIAEDLLAAVRYKEDIMSNTQQSDNNVKAETYGIDHYVFNKAHSNDPIYLNTYGF